DAGLAAAGEQRAEHDDGGAQPLDQLVAGLGVDLVGHVDDELAGPQGAAGTDVPEDVRHPLDVGDGRDVGDAVTARGQQRGGHQLEHRVLGAADGDGALQRSRGTDGDGWTGGLHGGQYAPHEGRRGGTATATAGSRSRPPGRRHRWPRRHTPVVATIIRTRLVDEAGLAELRTPMDGVLLERPAGDGRFEMVEGPFRSYERTVTVRPVGDGAVEATERIEYELATPVWRPLLALPVRWLLGREPR